MTFVLVRWADGDFGITGWGALFLVWGAALIGAAIQEAKK